ncbi:MAG: hypothetical protein ACE5EZ_04415 [Thermodesulfobacteriota bacterium]
MFEFQIFYYFYNDLFFAGEIPRWLSFVSYGMQSDPSLIGNLTATQCVSMLMGLIFRIKSVIFLYNLAILFEQLILLVGTYLLARCLFKDKTTVIFVSIITICSSVVLFQPYFNFHIYSYLPLIIFFITRFFSTTKLRYLMLSGICFSASFFGSATYCIPIEALAIMVIFGVLFCAHLKRWRLFLSPSRGDLLVSGALFLIFITTAGCFYYFIANSMEFTDGLSIGRDPVTHATYLDTYLSYGSDTIGFKKFTALIFPAPKFVLTDITLHIGLISLAFVLYALIFVRSAVFIAFAAIIALFTLFSLGPKTPVAELLYYYFPMMKYYRHVGHTVGNFKVFLPFMAGFGLDHFLKRFAPAGEETGAANEGISMQRARTALPPEVLFSALLLLGSLIYSRYVMLNIQGTALGLSGAFLLCLFILLRSTAAARRISIFLLACTLFQMLSYQTLVSYMFHQTSARYRPVGEETLKVSRYGFQERRLPAVPEGRPAEASRFTDQSVYAMVLKPTVTYTFAYGFLQWDPCIPAYRIDLLNTHVASLLRLISGGKFAQRGDNKLLLPYNRALLQIVGCSAPKLKLSSNVIFADTPEESSSIIKEGRDMSSLIVLNGVDEKTRAAWRAADSTDTSGGGGAITVKGFSSNGLRLKVRVARAAGSWLYYADAWHPDWKAFVNQRQVPIARANMAFKAIKLEGGENDVEFVFEKTPLRRLADLLIAFELLFITVFFVATLLILFPLSTGRNRS